MELTKEETIKEGWSWVFWRVGVIKTTIFGSHTVLREKGGGELGHSPWEEPHLYALFTISASVTLSSPGVLWSVEWSKLIAFLLWNEIFRTSWLLSEKPIHLVFACDSHLHTFLDPGVFCLLALTVSSLWWAQKLVSTTRWFSSAQPPSSLSPWFHRLWWGRSCDHWGKWLG